MNGCLTTTQEGRERAIQGASAEITGRPPTYAGDIEGVEASEGLTLTADFQEDLETRSQKLLETAMRRDMSYSRGSYRYTKGLAHRTATQDIFTGAKSLIDNIP